MTLNDQWLDAVMRQLFYINLASSAESWQGFKLNLPVQEEHWIEWIKQPDVRCLVQNFLNNLETSWQSHSPAGAMPPAPSAKPDMRLSVEVEDDRLPVDERSVDDECAAQDVDPVADLPVPFCTPEVKSSDQTSMVSPLASYSVDSVDVSPSSPAIDLSHLRPSPMSTEKRPPMPCQPRVNVNIKQLPNAKMGVAYSALIDLQTDTGEPVQLVSMHCATPIGLSFDPERGEVSGTPTASGDFVLSFCLLFPSREYSSVDSTLIINPDPRSLWKVLEPAASVPYAKPHTMHQLLQQDGFRMMAASRRGRSHEHSGTFRDDDYVIGFDPDSGFGVMVVADGAGSAKFSREGARVAAKTFADYLQQQTSHANWQPITEQILQRKQLDDSAKKQLYDQLYYLFQEAAKQSVEAIEQAAQLAHSQPRDFATTLLSVIFLRMGTTLFVASCWIGDGAIAVYAPTGQFRLMGSPDGGEYAGQTRFLDQAVLNASDFHKRIQLAYVDDAIALLLMTDGVSDPRFETDQNLANPQYWEQLWHDLKPVCEDADPSQALLDWLHFFTIGHHDDRTLAVYWPDAVQGLA